MPRFAPSAAKQPVEKRVERPKAPTGAESMMKALADRGVEACFANPGTTEMWLVGALDAEPRVRPVLGLHETVCAGAVDGYARMARKPACTILHLGPGLANALANLHNARRANVPVLNIVGDMSTWHRGADALLEMDVEARSISHWFPYDRVRVVNADP